ncbi:hypothetical protein BLS_004900 [Venturia inaequalis]|uniref:Uncharacterized protein n=1 Tax=Venturia inaequalis TaxID=5025 RepID=A0A8H3UHQ8_VENIN|nr:hypothetical protein BLS_004900 [Venturia inaequalis]KAE9974343.1 hypothetical protein EG328_003927 [Venturia inaequalis]KAE9992638.1 hypothetical protein EG327_008381 [Venturia inaequalis]
METSTMATSNAIDTSSESSKEKHPARPKLCINGVEVNLESGLPTPPPRPPLTPPQPTTTNASSEATGKAQEKAPLSTTKNQYHAYDFRSTKRNGLSYKGNDKSFVLNHAPHRIAKTAQNSTALLHPGIYLKAKRARVKKRSAASTKTR